MDRTTNPSVPEDFAALAVARDTLRIVLAIGEQIEDIKELLAVNPSQTIDRKWLTPKEFSERLKVHGPKHRQMVPNTVRDNCNNGRLNCIKNGWRGKHQLWLLPVEEVQRFIDEGLLPPTNGYKHPR